MLMNVVLAMSDLVSVFTFLKTVSESSVNPVSFLLVNALAFVDPDPE